MINPYHARVIDRLREAAKEHGEVAALLQCLSESFPYLRTRDLSFCGAEKDRAYLDAVLDAAAFVEVDRGVMEESDD